MNTETRTNAAGNAIELSTVTSAGNSIDLDNSGVLIADDAGDVSGIYTVTNTDSSPISIQNSATITVTSGVDAYGISAYTDGDNSRISIVNSGDIWVTGGDGAASGGRARGFYAYTADDNSRISIVNSGDIWATGGDGTTSSGGDAHGFYAVTKGDNSRISIVNSGDIWLTGFSPYGMFVTTDGKNSPISIVNSGDIWATGTERFAEGIFAATDNEFSPISIVNSGDVWADAATGAYGIYGLADGDSSPVTIKNSGDVSAKGGEAAFGLWGETDGSDSPVRIVNSGDVSAKGGDGDSVGIVALASKPRSPITIKNSGSVFAEGTGFVAGIHTYSATGTTIVNSGTISASSLLAIFSDGGKTKIFNSGMITGYVVLDADDTFINQKGGTFEARLTSDFGPGTDLFRNESGATVHTAGYAGTKETTRFINLERFENRGLISLQDGGIGDIFQISNTVGGTGLAFKASGNSTLAVDAFLGPPSSAADNFIIDGNVSGKTGVVVNNTNSGPGAFNQKGIPVVFVTGNVNGNQFFLKHGPIDTGFFDYDLFFVPTGSGFFELRSFPGGGAHLLPQLTTAAQDIFFTTSDTWFDRTADLRVLLNGGAPGGDAAYMKGAPSYDGSAFTPAVWVRGTGAWTEYDDSASTTAYGRTSRFDLTRDLTVFDFETGVDFGKRAVFSGNDMLVFGILGGVVEASLDYDTLIRKFHLDGGEIGAYATYLNGGLFVDTLVKVDFLEIETRTLGFPNTIDATTFGVRTDAGYRFGGFGGGAFIEPLATIAVAWSDLDGFTRGGNKVSFDDEANVRGRVGLRVGTSSQVWSGVTMEPFVIGSLWGTLSGDNTATLVSTGKTFSFTDEPPDAWGQVSTGVNFFNPSANTSVFAKLDVNFGDDLTGVAGRAGMRVKW